MGKDVCGSVISLLAKDVMGSCSLSVGSTLALGEMSISVSPISVSEELWEVSSSVNSVNSVTACDDDLAAEQEAVAEAVVCKGKEDLEDAEEVEEVEQEGERVWLDEYDR